MPKIIENLSQKLTDEARRQVMEEGYSALNIRTVAKNCGVGVGTVYNYFPSKDALVAGFMLEDWMMSLTRIRVCAESASDAFPVLEAIHRELTAFLTQYGELFRAASENISAPPKQYHVMLRRQLSEILLPICGETFLADFVSEALLTWTVEGKTFGQLRDIFEKVLK